MAILFSRSEYLRFKDEDYRAGFLRAARYEDARHCCDLLNAVELGLNFRLSSVQNGGPGPATPSPPFRCELLMIFRKGMAGWV